MMYNKIEIFGAVLYLMRIKKVLLLFLVSFTYSKTVAR